MHRYIRSSVAKFLSELFVVWSEASHCAMPGQLGLGLLGLGQSAFWWKGLTNWQSVWHIITPHPPHHQAWWNNVQSRVWRIYSNIQIFEYFWSKYLFGYSFVSFFWYEYIWLFVRINFLDTNIFGYSFVAIFWYEYIRIFVRINFQIPTMFLFYFYRYYTLLMDILLIFLMIKNAI